MTAAPKRLCAVCEKREATELIGDIFVLNHGGGKWWCLPCLLRKQIEHAEARAAALPELRARLKEAESNG